MAKEKMLCPFSKQLCRECPLYRGRHYYLCFSKSYRGHLEKPGGEAERDNPGTLEPVWQPDKMPSAVDPFQRPLPDIMD